MQVLWKKEIEEIKDSGYLRNDISITDALIENFFNEILYPTDKALLQLAFSKNPTQQDLDTLLKDFDIEVKGGAKSLMLSYFMKRHPELNFTSYEGPRLKGLLNFFRFKNLKTISHFTKIGRELNKAGITPMLLKGGAMKFLRQDLPRVMSDIDILVPEKDLMKCAKLAEPLGYWWEKVDIHAIDLHPAGSEEGALDVHKFIYMESGHEKELLKGLYKRAHNIVAFGVNALIPSNEDLLFISLVNLARNLRNKTSQAGLLYTLFDCKFLMESKPDFDWDIVKENARKTQTEIQMNFAMKFIEKISSDVLPDEIKNDKLFEKETSEYSNMVMYNRFYLEDLRTKCRAMKIGNLFKNPEQIPEYIALKPKYFLLKRIRKHPKLIELLIKDLKTKQYDFSK